MAESLPEASRSPRALLIGSTGFDGVSRGSLWKGLVAEYGRSTAGYLLLGTAGLLACIGIVLACYLVAIRTSRKYTSVPGPDLATRFVHSMVPIALGYTIAPTCTSPMVWVLTSE